MPQAMTAEQVLREIYQTHPEVFGDGARLAAFFSDYSRGKLRPQQNQLEIFLKCDGNTRILKVRSAPQATQQTEYARLIRTIIDDYGMQDAAARKICDAFWRVVTGTGPPVAQASPCDADAEALYLRGMEYWYGSGAAVGIPMEQRCAQAAQWLEKAAELNHLDAQARLDSLYNTKTWSGYDPARSVYWCRRAAERGYPNGQLSMGTHYKKGDGVAQNYYEAARWYQKAAAQGSTIAMVALCDLYWHELNAPGLAFEWCERAAEMGERTAQFILGQMYMQGVGTAKNPAQAVYWHKRADTPLAAQELARCYREGIGVPKDDAQAEYWQSRA